VSPSRITGTRFWPEKAIAALSVKRHGTVSTASPLWASASLARQQNGLNRRDGSAAARSCITIATPPLWKSGGGASSAARASQG